MSTQIPENLFYTKDHQWIKDDGKTCMIGMTRYAIEQLGDVVHIGFPNKGSHIEADGAYGTIESTKTVSDLFSPVSGEVTDINSVLEASPQTIVKDPYEQGWLLKVKKNDSQKEGLLSAEEYTKYLEKHT